MVDDKYPEGWDTFPAELVQFLSSTEYQHVMGGLVAFYEVAKKFQ